MKYKYRAIASQGKWIIRRTHYESMCIIDEYFTGYGYMGHANWTESCLSNSIREMGKEEAEQIINDLEATDYEEAFPAGRKYLFRARIDDELILSIETAERIAEIYEEDQLSGIYGDMEVWDVSGEPKEINYLDLVKPILEHKRWMEREYRDYCDAVNEYGYDFEGREE